MKTTIKKELLLESLKKGAYAALSDEAQSDTSTLSPIIKAVKITTTSDEIVFESSTALISSRYVLPVDGDTVVKEDGVIMVGAKDLYEWVNRSGDCYIGFSSKDLKDPQTVNVVGDGADVASKSLIKKVCKVNLVSRDDSKTGSKWALDGYDSSVVPELIDLKNDEKPLFEITLDKLIEAVKLTSFSVLPKDPEHIFDSLSFQKMGDDIYVVSTDATRCAAFKISDANIGTIEECISYEDIRNGNNSNAYGYNVLVSQKFLNDASKLLSKNHVVGFYRDETKNKVYISQPGFAIKFSTAEKDAVSKFPPVSLFLAKKYEDLCIVDKQTLLNRLNTVSLVNKNAIMFDFQNDQLILHGMSEMGYAPCQANMEVKNLSDDIKKVWNVKHFLESLKVFESDDIKIMLPSVTEKNSVRVVDPSKENLLYISMAIEKSKYETDSN